MQNLITYLITILKGIAAGAPQETNDTISEYLSGLQKRLMNVNMNELDLVAAAKGEIRILESELNKWTGDDVSRDAVKSVIELAKAVTGGDDGGNHPPDPPPNKH